MATRKSPEGDNISQSMRIGSIASGGDTHISQEVTSRSGVTSVTNSTEFVQRINELVKELSQFSTLSPDVKTAQDELRKAITEAQKPKPDTSKIRRLLYSAKGFLEITGALASIAAFVGQLANQVPTIFH
jgi:ribosomal 50S subunit-associated protein YjgA (DUF615 family)